MRHRPFVYFWATRIASILGFQIVMVAVGWQLYLLTGKALDLGLLGLAQFLPVLLVTIPAGAIADRFDRRRIVALCQAIEAVTIAALTFGMLSGALGRNGIIALAAILGAARAFEHPAMASLLPNLLPRELVPRGTAWSVSANQAAQIAGPALGGALLWLAPWLAGAASLALFALAVTLVSSIRSPRIERRSEPVTVVSLLSGFRFVVQHRLLLGTLSLDLFVVLLGGATALLPIYARDILHVGPAGLGMLRAAPAVGALAMSIWLARNPLGDGVGRKLFAAVITFGLATIAFGLSTAMPAALLALAVLGAADVISVVIRFSLVQLNTPDEMRGRVSAVNSLFIGASNQLGEFESGAVAALTSAVASAVIGGIGSIAVALAWMRLFPELRKIRSLDPSG